MFTSSMLPRQQQMHVRSTNMLERFNGELWPMRVIRVFSSAGWRRTTT